MTYAHAATARKSKRKPRPSVGLTPLNGRNPVEGEVFLQLCSLCALPIAVAAKLLYEAGEYEQLVKLKLDPFFADWTGYSPQEFMLAYQVVSFFSKNASLPTSVDRRSAAFQKWLQSETRCRAINQLFRERWSGKAVPLHDSIEAVLHGARSKISRILRDITESDIIAIRDRCRFGPGSDIGSRGNRVAAYDKFGSPGTVTPSLLELSDIIFDDDVRNDGIQLAELVDSSRLSFVPKTALTDRAICVEPRWNVYIQLGIGSLIADRLRRFGFNLDIRDQTKNQRLASRAQVDHLATIDLSSASDSMSTNLVVDLLSSCDDLWLDLLLKSRCVSTVYQKQKFRLEKISSMGNGYTFPLETLIFFALAWSASEHLGFGARVKEDVSVYGDDIIVPREVAALLIHTLRSVGFETNVNKTYITGAFYESCGQDYYRGRNVRPFFVKKAVISVQDAYLLANQIARFASNFIGVPGFAHREIWSIRDTVIRRIPKSLRFFGPVSGGDGVIHSTSDVWLHFGRPLSGGWEGFRFKCIQVVAITRKCFRYYPLLWSKLNGGTDCGNEVSSRDLTTSRVGVVQVPHCTDLFLI